MDHDKTKTKLRPIVCAADLTASPKSRTLLEQHFDCRFIEPSPKALAEAIREAHAYYASLHVRLEKEMIESAPNLRAIATPSTGLDHIDVETAGSRGIAVIGLKNDREFLDRVPATAELTWTLLLACARHLPAAFDVARQGRWARDEFRGHQLFEKTLGLLGCGRLGSIVARYGMAFGMRVIGHDVQSVQPEGVEMVTLDELLAQADVLSIHIHLTEENRGFVNRERILAMKPGAILLNTSRGAIVNESALLEALENGHLLAAGVDVIDGEWRKDLENHPMIQYARTHENLIITPHIGGVTYESQSAAFEQAAEKLIEFFSCPVET